MGTATAPIFTGLLAVAFFREFRFHWMSLAGTLAALNPRRQLERGYAILFDPAENRPVTTSKLPAGTPLRAQLADGEMDVEVK